MNKTKNPLGLQTVRSIQSEGLVPVGKRTNLRHYVADLFKRRHFIIAESKAKLSSSNRKNLLGYAWMFIGPLLSVLAFWFIFGFILQTSKGVYNFVGFLIIGVFLFQYTAKCMVSGTSAIRSGAAMIKGFQFPRAALPISIVVKNAMDFVPTFFVMLILLAIIPPAEPVSWQAPLVLVVLFLQTIFNVGLACLLARLGHKLPDLANLMPVISRFWLYGSGVLFVIDDKLQKFPELLTVMHLNPMYAYLELARNCLIYGSPSPLWMWLVAISWALGMLIVGFLYFWRGEEKYGRLS